MNQQLTTHTNANLAIAVEQALVTGDLKGLSVEGRLNYYHSLCSSLGLNPLSKPFAYIELNGKLTLYALKDCTDQLRRIFSVSVQIMSREIKGDVYVVTARASFPDGRMDESTGAVAVTNKKGDDLANAYMKAETKAKRRVTLSICGLGMLDESEADSIPGARVQMPDFPPAEMNGAAPSPTNSWDKTVREPAKETLKQASEQTPAVEGQASDFSEEKLLKNLEAQYQGAKGAQDVDALFEQFRKEHPKANGAFFQKAYEMRRARKLQIANAALNSVKQ